MNPRSGTALKLQARSWRPAQNRTTWLYIGVHLVFTGSRSIAPQLRRTRPVKRFLGIRPPIQSLRAMAALRCDHRRGRSRPRTPSLKTVVIRLWPLLNLIRKAALVRDLATPVRIAGHNACRMVTDCRRPSSWRLSLAIRSRREMRLIFFSVCRWILISNVFYIVLFCSLLTASLFQHLKIPHQSFVSHHTALQLVRSYHRYHTERTLLAGSRSVYLRYRFGLTVHSFEGMHSTIMWLAYDLTHYSCHQLFVHVSLLSTATLEACCVYTVHVSI